MVAQAALRLTRRRLAAGLLVTPLGLAGSTVARAAPSYEFGIAGIDPIYTAAFVAFKKGYFRDAGLEISHINSQSGPRTKQILAAGQILIGSSGVNDALATTIAGKATKVVFGMDRRISYANILIRSEDAGKYKSLSDLAGRKLAVTQLQSATWLMAVFMLDKAGAKDVDIRGLGDFSTMLGALKSKQVDATVATVAMLDQVAREGWAKPLFSIADEASWNATFGGDVPGIGCYVMAEQVQRNPAALQGAVTALVKGQDFINANSAETLTDLLHEEFMSGLPRDTVTSSLKLYKQSVFSANNIISEESYARLLGIMGGGRQFTAEEIAKVPYKTAIDMAFVRKARGM